MNLKYSCALISVVLAITFVASFTDGRYLLVKVKDEDERTDSGIKIVIECF